ncbi:hypothetical protein EJB05_07543, partial [Eragrostis curvula]
MPFRPTLLRRCSHDPKLTSFLSAVSSLAASRSSSPPAGAVPPAPTPAAYNALMSAYSSAGSSDEVLRLFRSLPFPRTTPLYTTLISSLAASGCHLAARAAFACLLRSGLPLTPSPFTALIKSHGAASIDFGYKVLDAMLALGCSPDAAAYNCLISVLCDYQRVEEARGLLEAMPDHKIYPTVCSFTPILHGYCEQGKVLEAERLVDYMMEVGCLPDVVSYSVLIEGLCRVGEFGKVERILGESEAKGWTPNAITYNIYMSALCRMNFLDEAFSQVAIMLSRGLSLTLETVNILFDCLCRGSRFHEAECLLEYSEELGWDADVFCYNTLMSRLCEAGDFAKVLKLLVDLLKKGIGPDMFSFTIAIRSLCNAGKLRLAKCLMENEGIEYDAVTFNTLIHGFCMVGDLRGVLVTYADMIGRNVMQNFTRDMVDNLCKERKFALAIDFLIGSLRDDFNKQYYKDMSCRNAFPNEFTNAMGYCKEENFLIVSLILDSILGEEELSCG